MILRFLFCSMIFFAGFKAHARSCHSPHNGYTEVFSLLPQHLLPDEAIRFEKIGEKSPEIDLSFVSSAGLIIFRRSGTYKISWEGRARSLLERSWTLGFSLDGLILFGNIYSPFERHPTIQRVEGSVVLSINAGQTLRLVNVSLHPVDLIPKKSDAKVPLPSFSLSIFLYKNDY